MALVQGDMRQGQKRVRLIGMNEIGAALGNRTKDQLSGILNYNPKRYVCNNVFFYAS